MICELSSNYVCAFYKLNTMRLHESCIYPVLWKHVVLEVRLNHRY